jgi:hypothetical protein
MSKNNPFGEPYEPKQKKNPFENEVVEDSVEASATRMDHAARKIRQLKTQMGAEGLSLSATRDLIDEVAAAIDSAARALRKLER